MAESPRWEVPGYVPRRRGLRLDFDPAQVQGRMIRGGVSCLETALWLPTHRHADRWEFHVVERGRLELELPEAGRRLEVPGGWCMVTPPGRQHRARDGVAGPCHLLWMQLDVRGDAPAWLGHDARAAVLAAWQTRTDQTWPAPPGLLDAVTRLRTAMQLPSPSPLATLRVRAAIAEVLALSALPGAAPIRPPGCDRALAILATAPSVDSAARTARIPTTTLHAWCRRHAGTTPAAWQLTHRLSLARDQLAAGIPVTEIARRLGFSSARYFAHAFRREVGMPPSLYAQVRAAAMAEPCRDW